MNARQAGCLDAAGIVDPVTRADFERCRALHARFGRSYYLATMLLPPAKRPFVHSLYGFARYTDEIVDRVDLQDQPARAAELAAWTRRTLAALRTGGSADPILRALAHTVSTWDIPIEHVEAFLDSMRMDLTITGYPTYLDLRRYMHGSAAVIGLQMTPILEPVDDRAPDRAAALGEAFQLTNFIRDIGEDLDRDRVYLPEEDLAAFGVTRAHLRRRQLTPAIRELIAFEIDRARELYRYAQDGIGMLAPSSQDCIRTAFRLYGGILRAVERAGYQVLDRRVRVGGARRVAIAAPAYLRARRHWAALAEGGFAPSSQGESHHQLR